MKAPADDGPDSDHQRFTSDVDAACEAYDTHPLSEPDAWGDVASFQTANGAHNETISLHDAPSGDFRWSVLVPRSPAEFRPP